MKKILFILLLPVFVYSQKPYSYLIKESDTIKNETLAGHNNATRFARMWYNMILKDSLGSSSMVYPNAGIPLSTGSAWGASYSTTGSGNVVLSNSPTLVSPSLGAVASGNFSTGTFTWPTFNQNTTGSAGSVPLSGITGLGSGWSSPLGSALGSGWATALGSTYSGGGAPFSDASALIKNSLDATKLVTLNASNIPSSTTQTAYFQYKPNFPYTVASLSDIMHIFNIKDYGAKGDGHYSGLTASISASSSTLTVSDITFSSADVGKVIEIPTAGSAGSLLVTTIAAYVSTHVVTLTASASTAASSQRIYYGTDDTSAIQSTINACFSSGGGIVYGPSGIYIINGPLITSDNNGNYPNSQIYIPSPPNTGNGGVYNYNITIKGETASNNLWALSNPNGTVFKSMMNQGTNLYPSIFGMAGYNVGPIGSLGSIIAGSSYTNGTYSGVSLTGGRGSGATANITVSGAKVTAVTLVNAGTGYVIGDVLSATAASIGGTGSGFSIPVLTSTATAYPFNYTNVTFDGVTILMDGNGAATKPNMIAINGLYAATIAVKNSIILADCYTGDTWGQQVWSTSSAGSGCTGVIASSINNNGPNLIERTVIGNFEYGLVIGEHTQLTMPYVYGCVNALVPLWNIYSITGSAWCGWNVNFMYVPYNVNLFGTKGGQAWMNLTLDLEPNNTSVFPGWFGANGALPVYNDAALYGAGEIAYNPHGSLTTQNDNLKSNAYSNNWLFLHPSFKPTMSQTSTAGGSVQNSYWNVANSNNAVFNVQDPFQGSSHYGVFLASTNQNATNALIGMYAAASPGLGGNYTAGGISWWTTGVTTNSQLYEYVGTGGVPVQTRNVTASNYSISLPLTIVNETTTTTSTVTAAGTTVLTVTSPGIQKFTGTTTQTVTLPVVTTLTNGFKFRIVNLSTGVVTVQSSGTNVIKAMASNSYIDLWVTDTTAGTGTASWNWYYNASLNN